MEENQTASSPPPLETEKEKETLEEVVAVETSSPSPEESQPSDDEKAPSPSPPPLEVDGKPSPDVKAERKSSQGRHVTFQEEVETVPATSTPTAEDDDEEMEIPSETPLTEQKEISDFETPQEEESSADVPPVEIPTKELLVENPESKTPSIETPSEQLLAENRESNLPSVETTEIPAERLFVETPESNLPSVETMEMEIPAEHLLVERTEAESLTEEEISTEDSSSQIESPPSSELGKIHNLLDNLEGGDETALESDLPPPPLFQRPEHRPHYERIDQLKSRIDEESVGITDLSYLDDFEEEVKEDVLMIGNVSLEEVQEEERRLRDEHVAYQRQEAERQRRVQKELAQREEEAKGDVTRLMKDKRKEIQLRESLTLQKDRLQHDMLQKAYRRAEQRLLTAFKRRRAEVKTMYGDLETADGQYGGSKGRRWKVDWSKTPQPIQIKLNCLRGVKDKLPASRYVMMVSMYDRLGGHVLRWSSLKGQQWGGATLPVTHNGFFHSVELKIDQSVFTVCPARPDIRPGMVLMFELFILRGSVTPTDRVVAWSAFPISDAEFNVIEGKYKCSLLRGDVDPRIDKHEKLEELMAKDLENWLGNLYFEVIKLPRYVAGQKEYEVELQFTSGLLGFPDRTNDPQSVVDGNDPILDEDAEAEAALAASRSSRRGSTVSGHSDAKSELRLRTAARLRPETSVQQSRKMLEGEESSDSDDDDAMNDAEDFVEEKANPGLYYKLHTRNPADKHYKKVYTMLPKTPLLKRKKKKAMSYAEELGQHSVAVKPPFSTKARTDRRSAKKVQYIGRQLLSELGLSQWRSREFWGMMIMFIIVFWVRLYLHYIGQWLFLNAIRIPVNRFEILAYTVFLNYQNTLLFTREEFGVVVVGPMTNIVIFALLIMASWASQRTFGSFPNLLSRFVIAFGIETALDPILLFVVDAAMMRYENQSGTGAIADAAKLYWHFYRLEGSGLAGAFLTVFIYFFTIFVTLSCLYMYFLKLHNNGRMLDIYNRLHGNETDFFSPQDLEVSNEELNYIIQKAEQWRGQEGERRKTAVYDYVWEEEEAERDVDRRKPIRREVTTHVSIYTVHLDGLRELHRHFLRLPDGTIVEVFGDIGAAGKYGLDDQTASRVQTTATTAGGNVRGFTPFMAASRPVTTAAYRPQTGFLAVPGAEAAGMK